MAINDNVGKLNTGDSANISLSGTGGQTSASNDTGSILAVKYIKDESSSTVSPSNIGTLALKNWFAEYVGVFGKFNRSLVSTTNIKWSDYRGATILGFKVRVKNETESQYKNANNAAIKIQPLNGDTTGSRSYTVQVGGTTKTSPGDANIGDEITFTGFNSGQVKAIRVIDENTNVQLQMSWKTAYKNGAASITGSSSVGLPGKPYSVNWADNNAKSTTYSQDMYFFLGKESGRAYGNTYS